MRRMILLGLVVVGLVVWVGVGVAQQWQYVAVIVSDASRDETAIVVESAKPIQVGRLIMLETREGDWRETYQVRHVYGQTIILEQKLRTAYVSGSKVYQ